MAPVSLAFIFSLLALPLLALARRSPHLTQASVTLFGTLASIDVLMLLTRLHPVARVALAAGLAAQLGRLAVLHRPAFERLVRHTLAPLAALPLVLLVGMHAARAAAERRAMRGIPPATAASPNVLLVVLDAVRARDLSLHGYARATSPALERLAARGVAFERAIATAPWTLPSHASLFTGREAHQLTTDWLVPLDAADPTLAEVLASRGYATGGFVGNLEYTTRESGLSRGFAHYDDYRFTPDAIVLAAQLPREVAGADWLRRPLGWYQAVARKHNAAVTDAAARWIREARGPWFAFLNLYDAHHPYLPPAPYDTLFTGARAPWSARNPSLLHTDTVTAARAQPERDAYDQAIRWQDDVLGAFLDSVDARGGLANTILVVTADHGEEFGEHGLLGHGSSLYFDALHVPLMIVFPGRVPAGGRVRQTVSLRDVAATALDLAGAPQTLPGRSLRPLWSATGADTAAARAAIAQVRYARGLPGWFPVSGGNMASALTNSRQLIRDGRGGVELFDLTLGPESVRPAPPGPDMDALLGTLLPPAVLSAPRR